MHWLSYALGLATLPALLATLDRWLRRRHARELRLEALHHWGMLAKLGLVGGPKDGERSVTR